MSTYYIVTDSETPTVSAVLSCLSVAQPLKSVRVLCGSLSGSFAVFVVRAKHSILPWGLIKACTPNNKYQLKLLLRLEL